MPPPVDPGLFRWLQQQYALGLGNLFAANPQLQFFSESRRQGLALHEALKLQGLGFEDLIARALPPGFERLSRGFPTFDFQQKALGVAISAKTLDMSTVYRLEPVNHPSLCRVLKGYIKQVRAYDRDDTPWAGSVVDASTLKARVLLVGIPTQTLEAQGLQIERARAFADQVNVLMAIIPIESKK